MRQLVVTLALFVVSASAAIPGASSMLTPFDVLKLAADDAAQCEGLPSGSLVCNSDCTGVLYCRGSTDPIEIEPCSEPDVCYYGMCQTGESSCEIENSPMECTSRGIFPDPYNCIKYHICKGENQQSIIESCCDGWAYDSATGLCSNWKNDTICEELPLSCSELGENNVFPGNDNIYYFCVKNAEGATIPVLYRCPHGGRYDNTTSVCVDSHETTTSGGGSGLLSDTSSSASFGILSACSSDSSSGTSSDNPSGTSSDNPSGSSSENPSGSSSENPSGSSTENPSGSSSENPSGPSDATPPSSAPTTDAPSEGATCSNSEEIVPDSQDCYSYYQCLSTKWFHFDCIDGFYFNLDEKKCVYGSCPYTFW